MTRIFKYSQFFEASGMVGTYSDAYMTTNLNRPCPVYYAYCKIFDNISSYIWRLLKTLQTANFFPTGEVFQLPKHVTGLESFMWACIDNCRKFVRVSAKHQQIRVKSNDNYAFCPFECWVILVKYSSLWWNTKIQHRVHKSPQWAHLSYNTLHKILNIYHFHSKLQFYPAAYLCLPTKLEDFPHGCGKTCCYILYINL